MSEQEKMQKLAILGTLAGVAFIIVFLFILFLIWKPKNINTSEEILTEYKIGDLGTYTYKTVSSEEKIKNYGVWIMDTMKRSDYTNLYNALNPEYIEYYGLNLGKFKELLNSKEIMGKYLKATEYKTTIVNGNKIIQIHIETPYKGSEFDIIITEYSPNEYKISFDDFISYKKNPIEYNFEGIKLTLTNRVIFSTSYKADAVLSNLSNKEVLINQNNNYEVFYLGTNQENIEILTKSTIFSGESYKLSPKGKLDFSWNFEIPSMNHEKIKSFIIKDVEFTESNVKKNIKMEMNKY